MAVVSKMTAVELPDDIFDLVFDHLDIRWIVFASHVCQRWRHAARTHIAFRGEASLTGAMDQHAIDFFFARREQAQLASGLISITVRPRGGLQEDPTRMSLMENRIVPAISTDIARLTALNIEVPAALQGTVFSALCQPAPALRSFTITNWDHRGSSVSVPADIFAARAPQLEVLRIGDGIILPGGPILGFRSVKSVSFLPGCNILASHPLRRLLDWFPELRKLGALATPSGFEPRDFLRDLTESELDQLRHFTSFSLDMGVYQAFRPLEAGNFVAISPNIDLCVWPPRRLSIPDTEIRGLVRSLIPQSHRWAACSINVRETEIHFRGSRDTAVVRKFPSLGANMDGLIWATLCSSASIATLYVDERTLTGFVRAQLSFSSLETLYISMRTQVPKCRYAQSGVASCPRLRSVILGFQDLGNRDSPDPRGGSVTCRGVDRFLSTRLSVKTWADVEVVLVGFSLFGPASSPGTQITGVSLRSRVECYKRNPELAPLVRNSP